jgi:antirestriction protein ArdC
MKKLTSADYARQDAERLAAAVNAVLDVLSREDLPERIGRSFIQAMKAPTRPSDRWSLLNRMIMWAHGTEDARGYQQWKEIGRYVKKGAKAFYILAPCTKKIVERNELEEEEERVILVGFKYIPVFRLEDTDGKPLPEVKTDYTPDVLPPLYEVAVEWGIDVKWMPANPGQRFYGWYDFVRDQIGLYTYEWGTFWHELAHAAHGRVVGRENMKFGQDPFQEIVAELTAATLSVMHGHDEELGYAKRYIESYARAPIRRDTKPALVLRAVAMVEKCLNLIFETAAQAVSKRAA